MSCKVTVIGAAIVDIFAGVVDKEILKKRRESWMPRKRRYTKGVLKLFADHAVSPMKGAYLE